MIYYGVQATPTPGGFHALKELCGPYTQLLLDNGAKSVQSFVVSAGQGVGTIAHVVAFDDQAAAMKTGTALQANDGWIKLQEKGAPVIASLNINTLRDLE